MLFSFTSAPWFAQITDRFLNSTSCQLRWCSISGPVSCCSLSKCDGRWPWSLPWLKLQLSFSISAHCRSLAPAGTAPYAEFKLCASLQLSAFHTTDTFNSLPSSSQKASSCSSDFSSLVLFILCLRSRTIVSHHSHCPIHAFTTVLSYC